MKCPIDQAELQMTERQGVEIDYCPKCRGVWLDRGELDKIIDRTNAVTAQEGQVLEPSREERRPREDYRDYEHGHKKHKREGFLGDLFDF